MGSSKYSSMGLTGYLLRLFKQALASFSSAAASESPRKSRRRTLQFTRSSHSAHALGTCSRHALVTLSARSRHALVTALINSPRFGVFADVHRYFARLLTSGHASGSSREKAASSRAALSAFVSSGPCAKMLSPPSLRRLSRPSSRKTFTPSSYIHRSCISSSIIPPTSLSQ